MQIETTQDQISQQLSMKTSSISSINTANTFYELPPL